jgi:hypothetical protein
LVVTFALLVTVFAPSVVTSGLPVTVSGLLVTVFAPPVNTFHINTHTLNGEPMNTSYSCSINSGGKAAKGEIKYGSLY